MAQDPNLVSDTCVLMNDGAAPNWWLSDDVKLTNPTGVAVPGTMNGVQITARRAMQNLRFPRGPVLSRVDFMFAIQPVHLLQPPHHRSNKFWILRAVRRVKSISHSPT